MKLYALHCFVLNIMYKSRTHVLTEDTITKSTRCMDNDGCLCQISCTLDMCKDLIAEGCVHHLIHASRGQNQ
eukprot:12848828-Ditylum_brightwellii.AAC.1